jgi:hypothetical protein
MPLRWDKNLILAYKNTFESPEGKKVLDDLKKRAPLLKDGLKVESGVDVNRLLVLEGRSDVIKYIYKMLGRDPNEVQPAKATNEPI